MKKASEISINDLVSGKEPDYINQIWIAIMEMNPFALTQLLDENINYEDMGKEKFIAKLNDTFNEYRSKGDSELLLDLDTCNSCNKGEPVCKFIGNNSRQKFSLFFEIKKCKIIDIYHCNWYGNMNFDLPF